MDYVLLGRMKAEFEQACRAIDHQAGKHNPLAAAWQALLNGDTGERDRQCDRARAVEDARKRAKTEAWLRIGESHGIDRDAALSAYRKVYQ